MGKTRVIRARVSGVCSGVRRALEIAEKAVVESDDPVYTLGDLVHNDLVMDHLRKKGIRSVRSIDGIEGGTVIIRAHGTTRATLEELAQRNVKVLDATCPKVTRSHRIIESHADLGYRVVVAGEPIHSEVQGLVSRAKDVSVAATAAEAQEIPCAPRMLVLSQTTFSTEVFEDICKVLRDRCKGIEVFETICPAMERRHEALMELAGEVDALVVVGGKASANTRRLYEKAVQTGKPAWQVEHAGELPPRVFRFSVVGLAAGASTPEWAVDEVERRLGGEGMHELD
jgi:4-hydroxy-3-methylbut-2-enyl diphosphate reductase